MTVTLTNTPATPNAQPTMPTPDCNMDITVGDYRMEVEPLTDGVCAQIFYEGRERKEAAIQPELRNGTWIVNFDSDGVETLSDFYGCGAISFNDVEEWLYDLAQHARVFEHILNTLFPPREG